MLNLKFLAVIVVLLISAIAAVVSHQREHLRAEQIKQTITVAPGTAHTVSAFKDR